MSEMPINCVMCSTNKHPSLMSSSDTCQDCGDINRHCKACGSNRLAKMWIDGSCLNCGVASVPDGAIANVIRNDNANVKPQIIDHLANLGWILFLEIFSKFVVRFFRYFFCSGQISLQVRAANSKLVYELRTIRLIR